MKSTAPNPGGGLGRRALGPPGPRPCPPQVLKMLISVNGGLDVWMYVRICPNMPEYARITAPARAPHTARYVGPGWGIDHLQKRYPWLNLVALRPHYDLVTLMDHMGSSLDRLEVDQRGRTFPPRAPRRLAATPNRNVSCLHTSIAPLPFVIGHF